MREHFSRGLALDSKERVSVPWLPETFLLDSPADVAAAMKADETYASTDPEVKCNHCNV